MTLYERDFLGLQWGIIVLQKPENLTAYCLLDRDYEYKVCDIVATNDAPYSQIIPMNHKLLSDADFLPATEKAIKTLMNNNVEGEKMAKAKKTYSNVCPKRCGSRMVLGKRNLPHVDVASAFRWRRRGGAREVLFAYRTKISIYE